MDNHKKESHLASIHKQKHTKQAKQKFEKNSAYKNISSSEFNKPYINPAEKYIIEEEYRKNIKYDIKHDIKHKIKQIVYEIW